MATPLFEILSERESGQGWAFEVGVVTESGELERRRLTVSFADYNLWCPSGSRSPAHVASVVMGAMLGRTALKDVPASFDASLLRKRDASSDREIAERITYEAG